MTDRPFRTPDFIAIGAQKAASTWLYDCLAEHPQIFMGPKNRVRYFQHPEYRADRWDWYLGHFARADEDQAIGDSRVEYLYHPESPGLIARHLPECRLIVSLRDPVDRALSALLWVQRRGLLPLEPPQIVLRKALARRGREPESPHEARLRDLLDMGLYAEQLERYFEAFDRDRFLILLTDDARERPEATMRSVLRFVGVDDGFLPRGLHRRPLRALGSRLQVRAERATTWLPGSLRISRRINRLLEATGLAKPPPELDPAVRAELEEVYRPHRGRLLELLREWASDPRTLSDHLRLDECAWLAT